MGAFYHAWRAANAAFDFPCPLPPGIIYLFMPKKQLHLLPLTRERLWLVLLLLGTALLSLWSLGSLPLIDVDEPVYGQVGKEMAQAPGGPAG